jgi:hypothetical protein
MKMTRKRLPMLRPLPLAVAILLANLAAAAARVQCPQPDSGGNPIVHNQHIFCGEINSRDRAVGFHSRPGGENPDTVTNTNNISVPPGAPAGIYNLRDFDITQDGTTRRKTISTMFPDHCSKDDVVAAIQHAANTGTGDEREFHGFSGDACKAGEPRAPFKIKGFFDDDGNVTTGYPDY